MATLAGIVTALFGAIIFFNLVKNVGTTSKPVTALGDITGAATNITSSLTK